MAVSMGTGVVRDHFETLGGLIFRLGSSHDRFTAQMRRSFDINAHERLAMTALWSDGPMTMTELGQWIPLSRAAVTTLVDRLEAAGIVTRSSDESDRRRTVVSLAQRAIDGMYPVVRPWSDELATLVAARSDAEWETISRFIEDLRLLNERHAERLTQMSDEQIQALAHSDGPTEERP